MKLTNLDHGLLIIEEPTLLFKKDNPLYRVLKKAIQSHCLASDDMNSFSGLLSNVFCKPKPRLR